MEYDRFLFQKRLKELIIERQLTQSQLAKITGINKSTISQYLAGYSKPNSNYADMLSRFFDVNKDWLLGGNIPREFGLLKQTHTVTKDELKSTLNENIITPNGDTIKENLMINIILNLYKFNRYALEKVYDTTEDFLQIEKYIEKDPE